MKHVITLLVAAILPMVAFAQSVNVTRSLEMLPNSQAVVQFNNIFGNWENREVDDSFPYVVIQMNLAGDAKAVSSAKMKIGLDVGTMYQVTATDKNQPNKILFLVPRGVRNIYVVCGDGCEKQLLHSGTLVENKVYECTVEYAAAVVSSGANNDALAEQMAAMQKRMEEMEKRNEQMEKQNEQMQQALQNQQKGGNADGVRKSVVQTPINNNDDKVRIEVNGVTFNMIKVEGGKFQMGANDSDGYEDEKSVHSVTLSDYYIGETEVTQALWVAVMGNNPSHHKGDNLPVEKVSWNECREFIQKLNGLTGWKFALPTEAQWEFAARGGNKGRGYEYSGSNDIGSVAWCDGNSSSQTHPVGLKQANELGIYDMSGNVYEWCQDWKEPYNNYSETNPTGPSSGSRRVLRGGSWISYVKNCRSTDRYSDSPDRSGSIYGLRLVLIP